MLIFWVTDNFLMRHNKHNKRRRRPHGGVLIGGAGGLASTSSPVDAHSLLQRVKVKYRSIRKDRKRAAESESEALISGDEEFLGVVTATPATQKAQQRSSVNSTTSLA